MQKYLVDQYFTLSYRTKCRLIMPKLLDRLLLISIRYCSHYTSKIKGRVEFYYFAYNLSTSRYRLYLLQKRMQNHSLKLLNMEDDPIVEIFTSINALSNQAKMDFSSIISFKSLPKKTFLLEAGKVANTLFFIEKGLARAFYNQDGEEITFYFAIDRQFIGSVPSLYSGKPSLCAIQLIEDSEVYCF
jgi:hypothetical protein